jgi:hypothetical protein
MSVSLGIRDPLQQRNSGRRLLGSLEQRRGNPSLKSGSLARLHILLLAATNRPPITLRCTPSINHATCSEILRDNVDFIPATHRQLHSRRIAFNVSVCASANASLQEAVKMETITIPSPSAFLSSPVIKPAPEPPPPPKRKPSTAPKSASTPKKQNGISKPKQSKSRNGTLGTQVLVLSWQ